MPTRKLGFTALLTALYSRLTTHALTLTYRFYNHAPRDAAMPYHVIGKPLGKVSDSFSTRDSAAEENVIEVNSRFDRASGLGEKPCSDAMDNIIQAITSSSLAITGYGVNYDAYLEYSNILLDETEATDPIWHGILRFRVVMTPTS